MLTKYIIFGDVGLLRIFKQTLIEKYAKSTKIATTTCNIQKFVPGEHAPGPLEPFLFLNLLRIGSTEITALEEESCVYASLPF